MDRVLPSSGLPVALFFAAVVALLNVGLVLTARADLAATGVASLAAGSWCALNFWRSRHAHCVVSGAGWLALAVFAFVEAGLGHSLIHGDEGLVFLAVLGAGLLFEGACYWVRRTNDVTRTPRPAALRSIGQCSLREGDFEERLDRWGAFLADHLLEHQEIPGGIGLRLRTSPAATAELKRLVRLEQSCCPWIEWSISERSVLEVDATAVRPEEVRALRSWTQRGRDSDHRFTEAPFQAWAADNPIPSSHHGRGTNRTTMDKTEASERAERPWPLSPERFRLRFRDPVLESAYRDDRFRHNVVNIRFAFLAGIALWVGWGLLLRPHILALSDLRLDALMRFGVFIPMLVIGLGLTFTPLFRRIWQLLSVVIAATTLLLWVYYSSHILTLPAEYGYVGVILITAFTYTLLRLRFLWVVLITAIGIAAYLPYAFTARYIAEVSRLLATLYLISFGALGGLAAYRIERFSRQVFLRERQLDLERERSDGLLLNILPQAIVDQLKTSEAGRIAQAFDQVTVLFADAVGSTEQAARSSPEEFAGALDELFRRFDHIADRHGLEKIKTIGDAYMAVAGAPVPMAEHAEAAVAMALDTIAEAGEIRWPSGDPIVVRVGVATGPAVAGIIGYRKFAYDLWGDTVNLASRLQECGEPGQVLVSQLTVEKLTDRYEFGPAQIVDLKGKGPTPAHVLIGRGSDVPISVRSS